mgnify:CR=1 FL=1
MGRILLLTTLLAAFTALTTFSVIPFGPGWEVAGVYIPGQVADVGIALTRARDGTPGVAEFREWLDSGVQAKRVIASRVVAESQQAVRDLAAWLRGSGAVAMKPDRDITWDEFLSAGRGQDDSHVELEANEPAYILATSGTTAKQKLLPSVRS